MDNNWMGNTAIPDISLIAINSYNCDFHRTGGVLAFNSKRINPGAATTSTNLWQVVGDVELKAIYGKITLATNVVGGPTACSFDLNDAAATVQLTSAAGTSLAGAIVNSFILKDAPAANALTLMDSSQCRYSEMAVGGSARSFFGGIVAQKNAVNTFIRFTCTTLAANDFTINFAVIWACRYLGSSLIAV